MKHSCPRCATRYTYCPVCNEHIHNAWFNKHKHTRPVF